MHVLLWLTPPFVWWHPVASLVLGKQFWHFERHNRRKDLLEEAYEEKDVKGQRGNGHKKHGQLWQEAAIQWDTLDAIGPQYTIRYWLGVKMEDAPVIFVPFFNPKDWQDCQIMNILKTLTRGTLHSLKCKGKKLHGVIKNWVVFPKLVRKNRRKSILRQIKPPK